MEKTGKFNYKKTFTNYKKFQRYVVIPKDIAEPTTQDAEDYCNTYNIKYIYQAILKVNVN